MDPSEFEDTIEKSADVISAGVLEDYFHQSSKPKYAPPVVDEVLGDCYRLLYDLQDQLKRLPTYEALESMMNTHDEQTVKFTEMKTEYLQRRKTLIATVKKFATAHLDPVISSSTDGGGDAEGEGLSSESMKELAIECRDVIDMFKKEYDFLSTLNKVIEQSFLSVYKLLLSIPDMHTSISQSVEHMLKQQELLKKCQEQFTIANQLIGVSNDGTIQSSSHGGVGLSMEGSVGGDGHHSTNDSSSTNLTSSISIHDIVSSTSLSSSTTNRQLENTIQKLQDELEQEKANHTAELLQMKNHYDIEIRNHEYSLQSKYEEQHLKQQQQYESLLSNKEEKLQLLVQELENNKLKAFAFDEKLQVLEMETKRRQQTEEKYQQLMIEMTDIQQVLQSKEKEKEKLLINHDLLMEDLQSKTQVLQKELDNVREKLSIAESELISRPPIELSSLLERAGLQHKVWGGRHHQQEQVEVDGDVTKDGSLTNMDRELTWKEVESLIIDELRKGENELVSIRIKEQEYEATIDRLSSQNMELQSRLKMKEVELSKVEKDLWQAHEALQQQRQSQRSYGNNQWDRHLSKGRVVNNNKQQKDREPEAVSPVTQESTSSSKGKSSTGITYEEMDDLLKSSDERNINNSEPLASDRSLENEFKKSSGESNGEMSTSSSSILQAIQHQRDRYMKAARELEEEISSLKTKYEKLQEEQNTLRNDNLELYRRVRMLRQSNPPFSSGNSGSTGSNHHSRDVRSRRGIGGWNENTTRYEDEENNLSNSGDINSGSTMDNIDRRYNSLYEQEMLSPFKIAELEKQQYLSRMNVMDRTIAWFYRNVMQDAWARHAFLIYIAMVHVFALFYVFQVLNPQLIEEVDAHMKAKWSTETMNLPEHPDV